MVLTQITINELAVTIGDLHFEIRYGNFTDDESLQTLARVGLGENCFHLEWIDKSSLENGSLNEIEKNIKFYLQERVLAQGRGINIQEIWEYMKYHATSSASNIYGNVHWVFVERRHDKFL